MIYSSEWCLLRFNDKANRPLADTITTASKYERLSESQHRVVMELASINPQSLVGPAQPLLTSDNKVFTFGTHPDGSPIVPFGKTGIYQSLSSIPQFPWREGVDYLDEGTQIRIPNNRTYSGTLYWRGVVMPPAIGIQIAPPAPDLTQPVLYPEPARELIVIDAVRQFATEYVRNAELADRMQNEWNIAWPKWTLAWRNQFRSGGAIRLLSAWNIMTSSFATI